MDSLGLDSATVVMLMLKALHDSTTYRGNHGAPVYTNHAGVVVSNVASAIRSGISDSRQVVHGWLVENCMPQLQGEGDSVTRLIMEIVGITN